MPLRRGAAPRVGRLAGVGIGVRPHLIKRRRSAGRIPQTPPLSPPQSELVMRAVVVSIAVLTAAFVLACTSTQKTQTPTPTPAPTTTQAPAPGGPGGLNRVRLSPMQMDSARRVTIA